MTDERNQNESPQQEPPKAQAPAKGTIEYHRQVFSKAASEGFSDQNAIVEILAHDIFTKHPPPAAESPKPSGGDSGPVEPPAPEDVARFTRLEQEDPEFESVRETMRRYANSLPEGEQKRLETDYKSFLSVYDRTRRELVRDREAEEYKSIPDHIREKIIQSKEIHYEKPKAPPEPSPQELADRREKEIMSELKRSDLSPEYRTELLVEMMLDRLPRKL